MRRRPCGSTAAVAMTDGPRRSTRKREAAAPSPEPPAAPSPDRPKKRARNQSQEQPPAPPSQAAPSAANSGAPSSPAPCAASSSAAGPSSEAASPAAAPPEAAPPAAASDQGSDAEPPEDLLCQFDDAELLDFIDGGGIDAIARHDTSSNNRAAAFIAYLSRPGAQLTEPMREGLIRLLRPIAAAPSTPSTSAAVRLIQLLDPPRVGPPRVGSHFPHQVDLNGALLPKGPLSINSAEDEACEWQQYAPKMTHITVQLRNEHGALCRRTRARMRAAFSTFEAASDQRLAPCLWQTRASRETRCGMAASSLS